MKKAFIEVINFDDKSNLGKLKNRGVILLCWLKRYGDTLFKNYTVSNIPIFIHYGGCNHNEGLFLRMLSKMPVDVVVFNPDLQAEFDMEDESLYKVVLSNSMELDEYPKKEKKIQKATVAYEAEKELDTVLYKNTGLFRKRQFVESSPITLKTTYEEIDILWKEHAKYRPYFEEKDNKVIVPAIFAQISGVKDANIQAYWSDIKKKTTENTLVIRELPNRHGIDENPVKPHVVHFYKNKKLQVDVIKKHHSYRYEYLNENVQDYILDKIQELIDLEWVISDSKGIEYAIVCTLLNLDKDTVRLIQKFDFTGEVPKIVIVNTIESMCSLEDCIYIAFLNLIGFDILIYVPTGYRTIKYLKKGIFEEHQIGEYLFDLTVPQLKSNNMGMFSKLWGKGR